MDDSNNPRPNFRAWKMCNSIGSQNFEGPSLAFDLIISICICAYIDSKLGFFTFFLFAIEKP